MIGKGKSISHTQASMAYGWNQEKDAEVVYKKLLVGDNPKEITQEFKLIQDLNHACKRNTLSFVISPTITDGKKLSEKDLNKITNEFIIQMKLENRQAIAFVHRNKAHTHIHLYVNRIDLKGRAYNDSFIGKASQRAAHVTAEKLGLTTVTQVQFENKWHTQEIRNEIRRRHDLTVKYQKPEDITQYIEGMRSNGVVVNPVINKSGQLQGFRFFFNGQQFKGSAVHRKMGISYLLKSIALNNKRQDLLISGNTLKLFSKLIPIPQKLALTLSQQNLMKKSINKGIGI